MFAVAVKKSLLLLISFCTMAVYGQFSVRFVVNSVAMKATDAIYVAGSFNNWNAADASTKLKPFGGNRFVFVLSNVPAGMLEYKFTRGSFDKVETTAKGEDINNRSITITGDTSVSDTIAGWKDAFPDKPIPNTASVNVHLLDTAFVIPQLNRTRRIWIYLPASYQTQKNKQYPVLYMQDGQNLFNRQTAAFGMEWGVDECIDSLGAQLHKECIVIGIDNSAQRMTEYNPYDNDKYGKGEGKQYAAFLATTLKPFVDAHYRTLKDAHHTYIAGSSMGALISMYTLVQYPGVFGAAGVFSPSFWIAPQLYTDVANADWKSQPRIYFYAGEKESNTMISDLQKMFNVVKQKSCCDVQRVIFPLGQHNENYWRDEFDDFYRWLMQ